MVNTVSELVPGKQTQVHRDEQALAKISNSRIKYLLGLYLLLSLIYNVVNPILEAPDAVWHFQYILYLARGNGLPHYVDKPLPMQQEASQPPLYYALGAPFVLLANTHDVTQTLVVNPHAALGNAAGYDNKNYVVHPPFERFPYHGTTLVVHLLRLLSTLLGVIAVLFTYKTARILLGETLGLLTAALVAFNPQFIFLNASVNNDSLIGMLGIIALYLIVVSWERPTLGKIVALGVVMGMAAIAKLSGLALIPLVSLALPFIAWRHQVKGKLIVWYAVIGTAIITIAGWWYLRNWMLYSDPTGLKVMFAIYPQRTQAPSFAKLIALFDGVRKSLWAVFGWFNVIVPSWIYTILSLWMLLGSVGFLHYLVKTVQRRDWEQLILWSIIAFWALTYVAALMKWALISSPQGRMLFPALSAMTLLWLKGWIDWLPAQVGKKFATASVVSLVLLAVVVPFAYIRPAYAAPKFVQASQLPAGLQRLDRTYADSVKLLGIKIQPATVKPGQELHVHSCWQMIKATTKNYSIFVHIWGRGGPNAHSKIPVQIGTYPGKGTLPTSAIPAGAIWCETYTLRIPPDLAAPTRLTVEMGMYDFWQHLSLPVTDSRGRPVTTGIVGYAALEPKSWPALPKQATHLHYQFADGIQLAGYTLENKQLTLYWKAYRQPQHDYTVFIHILDQRGNMVCGSDSMPVNSNFPTSMWPRGAVVEDVRMLNLSSLLPGTYSLQTGIYWLETMERLPVTGPAGPIPDRSVPLCALLVP